MTFSVAGALPPLRAAEAQQYAPGMVYSSASPNIGMSTKSDTLFGDPMRIATWNVNSLRVRLEIVVDWLIHDEPDVVCLQETKATDEVFPVEPLVAAGYQAVFTGQKTYNGVAILSRLPLTEVVRALPEAPGEDEKRF